jgi:hypothetical protein
MWEEWRKRTISEMIKCEKEEKNKRERKKNSKKNLNNLVKN